MRKRPSPARPKAALTACSPDSTPGSAGAWYWANETYQPEMRKIFQKAYLELHGHQHELSHDVYDVRDNFVPIQF